MSERKNPERLSRAPRPRRTSRTLFGLAIGGVCLWMVLNALSVVLNLAHQALVLTMAAIVAVAVVRLVGGRRS